MQGDKEPHLVPWVRGGRRSGWCRVPWSDTSNITKKVVHLTVPSRYLGRQGRNLCLHQSHLQSWEGVEMGATGQRVIQRQVTHVCQISNLPVRSAVSASHRIPNRGTNCMAQLGEGASRLAAGPYLAPESSFSPSSYLPRLLSLSRLSSRKAGEREKGTGKLRLPP